MIPTKILAIAVLCALAVLAVPVDDLSAVGSADAYACYPDNVDCHVRQARCLVEIVTEGEPCPL